MKIAKTGHQRFIAMGVPALDHASQFLRQLENYCNEVNDPSLLAMTGEQAKAILNFIVKHNMHNATLVRFMQERIRISERQGQFSLEQKRKKAAERAA